MQVIISQKEVSFESIKDEKCIEIEGKMQFITMYAKKALQNRTFSLLESVDQDIIFQVIATSSPEEKIINKCFVVCNKLHSGTFFDWFEVNQKNYQFISSEDKKSLFNHYQENFHCNSSILSETVDFYWSFFGLIKKINLGIDDSIGFIFHILVDRDEIIVCQIFNKIINNEFILFEEIKLLRSIMNEIDEHVINS